ncbi:MAG TPA: PilZ domain-containing protein [Pyrinomonadaceae bacterium]|jgi:hypothetical protein|nr:PilZ domain-containing protein [Pyrinomonadaceae bacterium]
MTDEKRKHDRVALVMEASWEGSGTKSVARTTDISLTGCFIDTLGQVGVGDVLNLRFTPPGGDYIAVEGKVMYQQNGVGFGVRFTRMADADRRRLESILNPEADPSKSSDY